MEMKPLGISQKLCEDSAIESRIESELFRCFLPGRKKKNPSSLCLCRVLLREGPKRSICCQDLSHESQSWPLRLVIEMCNMEYLGGNLMEGYTVPFCIWSPWCPAHSGAFMFWLERKALWEPQIRKYVAGGGRTRHQGCGQECDHKAFVFMISNLGLSLYWWF